MNQLEPKAQDKILQLAKEGNRETIAALLNHRLQVRGIKAQVNWQEQGLVIRLEADTIPDRAFSIETLERGLKKIDIQGIETVQIVAYRWGSTQSAWSYTLTLPKPLAIDLAAWLESGSSLKEALIAPPPAIPPLPPEPEQKFLCFQLGLEHSAMFPLEEVREVLRVPIEQILPVPDLPVSVLGLYNWRGEILWLIDFKNLLGLDSLFLTSCSIATTLDVIVLARDNQVLGLVVQEVDEIEQHNPKHLQAPRGLFSPQLEPFLSGYLQDARSIIFKAEAIFQAPPLARTVNAIVYN